MLGLVVALMLCAPGAFGLCEYTAMRNRDIVGDNLARFANLSEEACMAKCEASFFCASAVARMGMCYLKAEEADLASFRSGFSVLACRKKTCVCPVPVPVPVPVPTPAPTPDRFDPPFCERPQVLEAVAATNALREPKGLQTLSCSDGLSEQALLWSRAMCAAAPARRAAGVSLLEHGDVRAKVEAAVGVSGWSRYAENILWNTADASGATAGANAIKQWERSPPHLQNMLNGALTTLGLGWAECDIGAAYGKVYFWTQIFVTAA